MLVRQEREAVKDWTGFAREAEVDACAEEAVQGIDDEKASLGSLEGVFDDRCIAEIERGRLSRGGGNDSAQQQQARRIAIQLGKARADYFGGRGLCGGVEDGAGLDWFAAEGYATTAKRGGDGQGDPGFSRSDIRREHG